MSSDTNQSLPPEGEENRLKDDTPDLPRPKADLPKRPARHPLTSFGLANFKAFGAAEQTIPLRPITLIFGPNSGGKSSLLHFLLWMKDVVGGKGLDIYHPSAGGKSVDLGGFKQIRHGTDPETAVQVKLKLRVEDAQGRERHLETVSAFAACDPPADYVRRLRAMVSERFADVLTRNPLEKLLAYSPAMETEVVRHVLQQLLSGDYGEYTVERRLKDCWEDEGQLTTPLNELRTTCCPKLRELYSKTAYGDLLESQTVKDEEKKPPTREELTWELQELGVAVLNSLNLPPQHAKAVSKASLIRFQVSEEGALLLFAERNSDNLLTLQRLDAAGLKGFVKGQPEGDNRAFSEDEFNTAASALIFGGSNSWLPGEVLFTQQSGTDVQGKLQELLVGTPELPGLLRLCEVATAGEYKTVGYLGPLRAYPARGMTVSALPKEMDAEGLYAWRLLYEREDVRSALSEWLMSPRVNPGYEIIVDHQVEFDTVTAALTKKLCHLIDGMKTDLADLYELHESEGRSREKQDDPLYTAYWTLQDWDHIGSIAKIMEAAKIEVASQATGRIYLKDRKTGKLVTSHDIGVGISQLIPAFVYAKAAKGEFIAIEEPETHIHPALQAELGDVFIESALQQGNTFLIETHSEHLILRLLRRIRETSSGTLKEGKTPLTPADIAVLYVEPGEGGSKIIEIPVGADGDFDRPWPNGFFMERADELF